MLSPVKNLLLIAFFMLNFQAFADELPSVQMSKTDIEFAEKSEQDFQKVQQSVAQIDQPKLNLEDVYKTANELEFLSGKLPQTGEGEGCKDCGAQIHNVSSKEADIQNGILVFISFSMPKASLVELSEQSQKYNATLVLRGIHEDSFLKTKDKILEINPKGLQLDIHPDLFKQYSIKRVPTFVLVKNGKEVNRLSGNVTLEFASSKLREEQVLAGHAVLAGQAINGVAQ
jgi:conjugal transfer pilus assembly protein TrbC